VTLADHEVFEGFAAGLRIVAGESLLSSRHEGE
jgi:hypothetical protein